MKYPIQISALSYCGAIIYNEDVVATIKFDYFKTRF